MCALIRLARDCNPGPFKAWTPHMWGRRAWHEVARHPLREESMKAHATYVLWALDRWALPRGRELIEMIGGASLVATNPWRQDEDKYGVATACAQGSCGIIGYLAMCCIPLPTGVYPALP